MYKSLNIYSSYFHGICDITQCKSAKLTALGTIKILSGFTVIVPIIFGLGYLITKHKKMLADSLAYVPKDTKEITIGFGRHPSVEKIDKTILELCKFKQLHTITFYLSKTTHYTKVIESLIRRSVNVIESETLFAKSSKDPFDLREDRVIVSGVSMPNNNKPVSRILHGVVYHLIKESALAKINFRFKSQPGKLDPVYLINPSRLDALNKDGWVALT